MRNSRKKQSPAAIVAKILFTLFLLCAIAFIFYNSSRVGSISGAFSQRVTEYLNAALAKAGLGVQLSDQLVRKLGHLGEYTLLGFFLLLTLRAYTGRVVAFVSWPLLFGLGLAVLDEFFQQFVPGRSSRVSDVMIDFAGILAGLSVALLLVLLVGAIQKALRKQ